MDEFASYRIQYDALRYDRFIVEREYREELKKWNDYNFSQRVFSRNRLAKLSAKIQDYNVAISDCLKAWKSAVEKKYK